MTTRTAISNTVEIDPSELSDYRYHGTRITPCLYSFDNTWICASKRKPTFGGHLSGLIWEPHNDQFWAQQAGTVIWTAKS